MKPIIWSYGGGTQSVAIAILIAKGLLPVPDRIVFADTGGEMSEVWDYLHTFVEPLLLSVGRHVEIASHDLATVDLYGHNGDLLIPAYTTGGKLPTFCSKEWKTYVVRRHLGGEKTIGQCVMWLGMSTDEVERLKPADVQWIEHRWPLCFDAPMNRVECRQLVLNYGWPDPPKSACVWCPHLQDAEWRRMKEYAPADFARAVVRDREIRKHDTVWLHKARRPLDEVDLSKDEQPSLFGCDTGYCWT